MKPTLRVIHHLQRTGGTLIAKCLASLPRTALLSEVNPGTPANFMVLDPVFQASFWLRLIGERTAADLAAASFGDKIKAIHLFARDRGEDLILRDWAYLDFFARPFAPEPTGVLSTARALERDFELLQVVTVRHPMDQWLSWCAYRGTAKAEDCGFAAFVDACAAFRRRTADLPHVRYEDFVAAPDAAMQTLCGHLELDFDPVYRRRWPYYHQITGDDNDRASGDWTIAPRPRRQPDPALAAEAGANEAYVRLLDAYGYS